ncbi:hypothetical protein Cadr_000007446 [Camelus dromedarius]|uniref:Uncharacterized protein n=1 Tax=Camelus dromedarius TaxID=9838 RepID=A0A5N4E685_CAMDR|nr:hypothetical protein Cadr_000007446 [Camelus dromedarius]
MKGKGKSRRRKKRRRKMRRKEREGREGVEGGVETEEAVMRGHYLYQCVASHYWNQIQLAFSEGITLISDTDLPSRCLYKDEKKEEEKEEEEKKEQEEKEEELEEKMTTLSK